ncbi:MAG: helix-turn-helix domain-containing protein [Bacilli bacterium]|nr:helix-turn-helix domain-containing protein [Bacilli bacterium]
MSASYLYLEAVNQIEPRIVDKFLFKIIGPNYELEKINDCNIYKVIFPQGQKTLALFKTCFDAVSSDLNAGIRALVVPLFYSNLMKYIKNVPFGTIKYLFEIGKDSENIYRDALVLINDIDYETLLTVKAYIENGNSPSLSAIRLFVHRNTVTYRIDRFMQETNIDLKPFANACFIFSLIDYKEKQLKEDFY